MPHNTKLIREMPYRCAAPGGGSQRAMLPWIRMHAEAMPHNLEAIVLTSDLQGVTDDGTLLGLAVAEHVSEERVGVILAGDLYSDARAARRGVSGDVRDVWRAFAARSRWVVGVAGNHDIFGETDADAEDFRRTERVHVLDGSDIEVDDLRIGGVSGIIGRAGRRWRRTPEEFRAAITMAFARKPQVLVLHECPDVPGDGCIGSAHVREALRTLEPPLPLVVCGHAHRSAPLAQLPNGGAQVLNVDSRVVILERRMR